MAGDYLFMAHRFLSKLPFSAADSLLSPALNENLGVLVISYIYIYIWTC